MGPFLGTTCVVGANGSGKSSVLQALLAGLGQGELPAESRIEVHLRGPQGQTRVLARKGEANLVDGSDHSLSDYRAMVAGVLGPVDKLFVSQGQVETLAVKSSRALTDLFEELSGSAELKDQYGAAKEEQGRSAGQLKDLLKLQSQLKAEKRSLRMLADNSEKYRALV